VEELPAQECRTPHSTDETFIGTLKTRVGSIKTEAELLGDPHCESELLPQHQTSELVEIAQK
jgi:hypothetical protein